MTQSQSNKIIASVNEGKRMFRRMLTDELQFLFNHSSASMPDITKTQFIESSGMSLSMWNKAAKGKTTLSARMLKRAESSVRVWAKRHRGLSSAYEARADPNRSDIYAGLGSMCDAWQTKLRLLNKLQRTHTLADYEVISKILRQYEVERSIELDDDEFPLPDPDLDLPDDDET